VEDVASIRHPVLYFERLSTPQVREDEGKSQGKSAVKTKRDSLENRFNFLLSNLEEER
jgi:hypothetical protein